MEDTFTETPKRPQFLTILCILTYIGVGFGVIGSILGWWGMSVMEKMIAENGGDLEGIPGIDMDNTAEIEKMMSMMEYSTIMLISGIVFSLVCLVGALQMWKQKKMGFYIYCVGEITPVIITFALMGTVAFSGWGVAGIIIPILFVGLYAANLKHLS